MSNALSRIHVEGFKSLENVDLEPGRVTVLIGPNGAGKSNLLSFLQMIPLIRTKSLRRIVGEWGGSSALLFYGPAVTPQLSFRLEFEQPPFVNSYSARLSHARDSFVFLEEEVGRRRDSDSELETFDLGVGHQESRLADTEWAPDRSTEKAVRWWLSRMSFFHFHDTSSTSELRSNARATDCRYLRSNGSNLAAYLGALCWSESEAQQKAWRRIRLIVRQVAPYIKELQPVRNGGDDKFVRLDWIDERDHVFSSYDLSDGTLRAIALITALAQPAENLPAFLSIDEPELGLHPAALVTLVGLIRSISHRCQILLATQSSALLDLFAPDEVVVTELNNGRTELKRLDPAQLSSWLEDCTLSELYDKNVLGGRP